MKISQIRIPASRLSRALLIAASISCLNFAGHVFASDTPEEVSRIVNTLTTNLAQQIPNDPSLEFKHVQLAVYEKSEAGDISLKTATTHNLGHLHELLKKKMAENKLNELQEAARRLKKKSSEEQLLTQGDAIVLPPLIDLVAIEAYGAFNFAYGRVDSNSVTKMAKICAANTWLIRALADYGIISEAYRSLYGAEEAVYERSISEEDTQLKAKLKTDTEAQVKVKVEEQSKFEKLKCSREIDIAKDERDYNQEEDEGRKNSLALQIAKSKAELAEMKRAHEASIAAIEAEIKKLNAKYDEKVAELRRDKTAALDQLEQQLAKVFENFGSSGGSKTLERSGIGGWFGLNPWDRSMRDEFPILDKKLSLTYTDLYPKAKSAMHVALFSLVADEDKAIQKQKRLIMKTLLELDDETYKNIIKTIIRNEVQKKKEQTGVIAEAQSIVKTALITMHVKPPLEPLAGNYTSEPTKAQSKIAQEVATTFTQKKSLTETDVGTEKKREPKMAPSSQPAAPAASSISTDGDCRLSSSDWVMLPRITDTVSNAGDSSSRDKKIQSGGAPASTDISATANTPTVTSTTPSGGQENATGQKKKNGRKKGSKNKGRGGC